MYRKKMERSYACVCMHLIIAFKDMQLRKIAGMLLREKKALTAHHELLNNNNNNNNNSKSNLIWIYLSNTNEKLRNLQLH